VAQQHAVTNAEYSAADFVDVMAADLDASPVLSRAPVIALTTGGMVGSLLSDVATDPGSRKSANMTECVPVPSSEHVAEIVGRQGNIVVSLLRLSSCSGIVILPARPYASVVLAMGLCLCVCITCQHCVKRLNGFSSFLAQKIPV